MVYNRDVASTCKLSDYRLVSIIAVNSRCFNFYRAYSISFNSSNVREKEKKIVVSFATTAKKFPKRSDARAKLLFCQSKPFCFSSRSRCLSFASNRDFKIQRRDGHENVA